MPTRQLPSGSFQARFKMNGEHYARAFPTREEAEQWEASLRAADTLGQHVPTPEALRGTVTQWAEWWLAPYEHRGSRNTYLQHEGNWRLRIKPALGHRRLVDVLPIDVEQLLDKVAREGSPNTALSTYRTLSAMFRSAVDNDKLGASPMRRRFRPKVQRRRAAILEPAEAQALLAALDGRGRQAAVLLLSFGMRWGELAALTPGDVDLEAGTLTIRHTVDQHHVGPVKTHEPRVLDIPDGEARLVLYDLVAEAGNPLPIPDLTTKDPDVKAYRWRWLMPTAYGNPWTPGAWAGRHLKPALEAAGIVKPITPHGFRHTYVTWNLREGVGVGIVAQWVGDLPTTIERTYAHVLASASNRSGDVVSRLLR